MLTGICEFDSARLRYYTKNRIFAIFRGRWIAMPKYSLILLDADGTLFDYDRAEQQALMRTCLDFELPYCDQVHQDYRAINQSLWNRLEKGAMQKSQLGQERFRQLFAAWDLNSDAGRFNAAYLDNLGDCAFLLPGARDICQLLHRHCRLAVATNGMAQVQRKRLAQSALAPFIAHLIISEETGYEKPDPRFFKHALQLAKQENKQEVLMVGDSLSADIQGGKNADIATCWYNRHAAPMVSECTPDYQIASLWELRSVVLLADELKVP